MTDSTSNGHNGHHCVNDQDDEYIVRSTCTAKLSRPNVIYAKYLADQVTSWDPDGIAIIDAATGEKLTFGLLHRKAHEYASALVQLGITNQDNICYFSDNSLEMAIAIIATEYLGVPFSLFYPQYKKYDFASAIQSFHGNVLVIGNNKLEVLKQTIEDKKIIGKLKDLKMFVQLNEPTLDEMFYDYDFFTGKKIITFQQGVKLGSGSVLEQIPYFHIIEPEKEHFYYISTSGTTGPPKIVIHTHRSFLNMLVGVGYPECLKKGTFTGLLPMCYSIGTVFLNNGLLNGATMVLFNSDKVPVDRVMAGVEKYKINIIHFGPYEINQLDKNDFQLKYDCSSLDFISYGSSKVAKQVELNLIEKYKVKIYNMYGSKESFGHLVHDTQELEDNFQPGGAGRVVPDVEMKVVDVQTRKSLPPLQQGEIAFRGPQVFVGYLDNEEDTRKTLDKNGWYFTGDLGYYDKTGQLFITDRLKELIKYKTFSIVPAEIEDFLLDQEEIAAAVVVGVSHPIDFQWIRAYVELEEGKTITEDKLVKLVAENLAQQKQLLGGVKFVTEMPRTAIGKILRNHFKELVKSESIPV